MYMHNDVQRILKEIKENVKWLLILSFVFEEKMIKYSKVLNYLLEMNKWWVGPAWDGWCMEFLCYFQIVPSETFELLCDEHTGTDTVELIE